jgi:hypothetical protein
MRASHTSQHIRRMSKQSRKHLGGERSECNQMTLGERYQRRAQRIQVFRTKMCNCHLEPVFAEKIIDGVAHVRRGKLRATKFATHISDASPPYHCTMREQKREDNKSKNELRLKSMRVCVWRERACVCERERERTRKNATLSPQTHAVGASSSLSFNTMSSDLLVSRFLPPVSFPPVAYLMTRKTQNIGRKKDQ